MGHPRLDGYLPALQDVEVTRFLLGAYQDRRKPFADEVQVLEEPRRAAVAVDERVDRQEIEVQPRGRHQRVFAWLACGSTLDHRVHERRNL